MNPGYSPGRIQFAELVGTFVLKFVGEVRRALSLLTNASSSEKSDAGHVQHAAHRLP